MDLEVEVSQQVNTPHGESGAWNLQLSTFNRKFSPQFVIRKWSDPSRFYILSPAFGILTMFISVWHSEHWPVLGTFSESQSRNLESAPSEA